ncbi:hypothetical protein D307_gp119 [Bacillus phage Bastille]|uniref:Uncharacterized protein n=1 Tax=Bacillus phage Bastille TaxID=57477 RepID=J9PLR1_9CAUD|nr:hypothetical protein D307_gp119 [Bacillus phage Bastille]AEQ34345.1 hypothetical protein [Bacillus phage Bastille]
MSPEFLRRMVQRAKERKIEEMEHKLGEPFMALVRKVDDLMYDAASETWSQIVVDTYHFFPEVRDMEHGDRIREVREPYFMNSDFNTYTDNLARYYCLRGFNAESGYNESVYEYAYVHSLKISWSLEGGE